MAAEATTWPHAIGIVGTKASQEGEAAISMCASPDMAWGIEPGAPTPEKNTCSPICSTDSVPALTGTGNRRRARGAKKRDAAAAAAASVPAEGAMPVVKLWPKADSNTAAQANAKARAGQDGQGPWTGGEHAEESIFTPSRVRGRVRDHSGQGLTIHQSVGEYRQLDRVAAAHCSALIR